MHCADDAAFTALLHLQMTCREKSCASLAQARLWLMLKCVICAMTVLYHVPVRATCRHSFQGPCTHDRRP